MFRYRVLSENFEQIKENEMGKPCVKEIREMRTEFWFGNLKFRGRLDGRDLGEMTILK
jgi:hypothetical protein